MYTNWRCCVLGMAVVLIAGACSSDKNSNPTDTLGSDTVATDGHSEIGVDDSVTGKDFLPEDGVSTDENSPDAVLSDSVVPDSVVPDSVTPDTVTSDTVEDTGDPGVILTGSFIVMAWNDLGMHCLNPTYDEAVILPPYNTVYAQVLRLGNPPVVTTEHIRLEYRIVDNTYSYGKTDNLGGVFAQFWDNAQALFGAAPEHDKGLNLEDPEISNGLSGTMKNAGDFFRADGIPVVPVNDAGVWNPYQRIEVKAYDTAGHLLATTHNTVPTSDEITCSKCHGTNAFNDILTKHGGAGPGELGSDLLSQKPVLCVHPAMALRPWDRLAPVPQAATCRKPSTVSTLPRTLPATTATRGLPPNAAEALPTPQPTAIVSSATVPWPKWAVPSPKERESPGWENPPVGPATTRESTEPASPG